MRSVLAGFLDINHDTGTVEFLQTGMPDQDEVFMRVTNLGVIPTQLGSIVLECTQQSGGLPASNDHATST